jgi:hypothetical protein
MGNFSKDPQATLKNALDHGYCRVRFQQGKPILDREMNLAADLASPERLAQQYIGDGVPDGSQGFQITNLNAVANDFTISAGRCQVAGREVVLANQTTYKGQPNPAKVAPLPAGASNVYLHVFPTEIGAAQDPDLSNVGDVSVETSVREKSDWEVLVSVVPITAPDHFLLAVINTAANSVVDRRRTGLTLSTVKDEVSTARGSASTLGDRLKVSLANDGTVNPGTVSITRMASTVVLNTQVSVQAAPAAGQKFEQAITLLTSPDPAFFLVSVHFDGPPVVGPVPLPLGRAFEWRYQVTLFKPPNSNANIHLYQVLIENPNTFAISVSVKAYRLAES